MSNQVSLNEKEVTFYSQILPAEISELLALFGLKINSIKLEPYTHSQSIPGSYWVNLKQD